MAQDPSSHALRQHLSIGNVINVSLYLYRSNLKFYSKLALIAHLWLLVPLYGWAKFFAISGLVSRLAFDDLSAQSESTDSARRQVERRMWHFLITGILVIILSLLGTLIAFILFSIIGGILYALLSWISGYPLATSADQLFKNWLYTGVIIPLSLSIYLSPLWFYSRLFITDLPLSIEKQTNFFKAIRQSWKLTKGLRMRLIGIILISFLITLPVLIIIWYGLNFVLALISYNFIRPYVGNYSIRVTLVVTVLSLVTGVIIMPFWQTLKAVVYYDIRCRLEGWDLKLRDRNTVMKNEL